MAEDISGNCPPLDLRMTHFRKRVLSTEADEKIPGRPSALSSPSRTLRKSFTYRREGEVTPHLDLPRKYRRALQRDAGQLL